MILKIGNNLVSQFSGFPVVRLFGCSVIRLNRQTGEPANRQTKQGFTLVELMLSVVILGFGLCVVIQSYMSALSGFNATQNYITAMRFAKEKIIELETAAYENKGLLPETKADRITLGARKFNWQAEVTEAPISGNFSKDFVMAIVSMNWQERDIRKNSAVVTYLPKRQELGEEKE